jgi:hypothetical protein
MYFETTDPQGAPGSLIGHGRSFNYPSVPRNIQVPRRTIVTGLWPSHQPDDLSENSAYAGALLKAGFTPQNKNQLNHMANMVSRWTPVLAKDTMEAYQQPLTVQDRHGQIRNVTLNCTIRSAEWEDRDRLSPLCKLIQKC